MLEAKKLREALASYEAYNAWERAERWQNLSRLTFHEGLSQFFELQTLSQKLAPAAKDIFLKHQTEHWQNLHQKLKRAATKMQDAKATRSLI